MLPNKKYAPEDLLRIVWRRKFLILVPALLVSMATLAWSLWLPNRYRSATSILIVPQRVPEDYVRSTVTSRIDERLQMISQQILSRTRLERIVQDFDLYKDERQTLIMEDIIEQMRQDISVTLGAARRREGASSFQVSYESSDARTAMVVTERIASLFVKENLEDREMLADATNEFLQAQLEEARRRLVEREGDLERFRERNTGRLPSQVTANLQLMQSTESQLQVQLEAGNRDRDRLAILQRAASEPEMLSAPSGVTADPFAGSGTAAQQLDAAKVGLQRLEARLKPEHPDVMRAKRVVADLQVKADVEALREPLAPLAPAAGRAATPEERAGRIRSAEVRVEIDAIQRRLAARAAEERRLQSLIGLHQSRVEAAPGLESELTELMRDYTTLQDAYTGMLRKSEESKISLNLERRQIGEQFQILDGARLPEKPISPDRVRINLMGTFGGFGLGLLLVGLLEYRDSSLKTYDDVVTALGLPVLAVIPAMITAARSRRLRRRRVLLTATISLAAALGLAGAALWNIKLIETWIR